MDISALTEEERVKFHKLVEMLKDEFGVLPSDLEEALEEVKNASAKSEAYGKNFFFDYIMPHQKSWELCLDIHNRIKNGYTFDRAVASCLCCY